MNSKVKKFLPLIISSSVLALAATANIIIFNTDVDHLPEITYEDIPASEAAYYDYQTAQKNYDNISASISELDQIISQKQEKKAYSKKELEELKEAVEELKEKQSGYSDITERYEKCLTEAQRLGDLWAVYRKMYLSHVEANYDANNLRRNQKASNIQSVIGDYTGIFGQAFADMLASNTYRGYDKVIACVNGITETANEHLYKAELLLSKIKTKTEIIDALLSGELKGERLLFEIELFESAYFGKDDLIEQERKELVYELDYSKAVLDAVYPVYEMILSNCDDNSQFLIILKNKSIEIENFLNFVSKSDSERLSKEQIGEITRTVYQIIPYIFDFSDRANLGVMFTDVNIVGPKRISTGGFLSKPDTIYYAEKNYKHTFAIAQYGDSASIPTKLFYYDYNGNPLYVKYKNNIVCMLDGEVVYSSDEAKTNSIVQTAKDDYNKYKR